MARFGGAPAALKGPPLAGQQNDEVLDNLGYTAAEIEQMTRDGVIWREAL